MLGLGAQWTFAQTDGASMSGRVTDQSNAAVADAEVQIRNTDTNIVTLFFRDGREVPLPKMTKFEVANRILDHVLQIHSR